MEIQKKKASGVGVCSHMLFFVEVVHGEGEEGSKLKTIVGSWFNNVARYLTINCYSSEYLALFQIKKRKYF